MATAARHHADWLSLIETSGPFLSMPVLLRVFPQELEAHDTGHAKALRRAYAEWDEAVGEDRAAPAPAPHQAFVRWVLAQTLGYGDDVLVEAQALPPGLAQKLPEHDLTLRPDLALVDPGTKSPVLLIQLYPADQDLERKLPGDRWPAGPATRMVELLRGTGIPLGLVTNGGRWMLVHAPRGEAVGFATWEALLWLEEPITLRAFRSLLAARRFFGVAESDTLLGLLRESAQNQQEVTDQLGLQVRHSVEILVAAIDRLDRTRGGTLLAGAAPRTLYEAACTFMMRLIFMLSAEEQKLFPIDDELYQTSYAVSTLAEQLRATADQQGEEVLELRFDAFGRLLATFRAIHGGVAHERLRIPAYGGSLFDPERFPFLEGRPPGAPLASAQPLEIDNRRVLHLLEALQRLQVRAPGGGKESRRLSFRSLDIEQIGHVYEGLLDHTAVRAEGPVLGLAGGKGKEPELDLAALEAKGQLSDEELIRWLEEETGRIYSTLARRFRCEEPVNESGLLVACEGDAALRDRVRPYAGLLREDTFGLPTVFAAGSVYVTQGSDRRSTGTHYTPRSLTEPIVRHALDPLVYRGMAEGNAPSVRSLLSARELLALKVCDLACGSGAFLVQACRYLAEKLVEAWEIAEDGAKPRLVVTPEGDLSTGDPRERPLPRDAEERLLLAKRAVADRCLYGVDKNPQAVEIAKLSLWLATLQKEKPFTFLDHAIRAGDSLLGVAKVEELAAFALGDTGSPSVLAASVRSALERARSKRLELESFSVETVEDAVRKARLLGEAQRETADLRLAGDLLVGCALSGEDTREYLPRVTSLLAVAPEGEGEAQREAREGLQESVRDSLGRDAGRMLDAGRREGQPRRTPFHWVIEFPEVFGEGFSAVVGNPPFRGGKLISGDLGSDYREYLVAQLARGTKGNADLCAFFFLRARDVLGADGQFGLLATNSISQGDTREVGLDQIVSSGCSIPRAVSSQEWPGVASLEVANVWVRRGPWTLPATLDGEPVAGISPYLTGLGSVIGQPHRLSSNQDRAFIGSYVLGLGFVLDPSEASELIALDPKNREVLFPYLGGEDINSNPGQVPGRWIINFWDWPLNRDTAPQGHAGPVAADFPKCLAIVKERVKPQRDSLQNKPRVKRNWWQFEYVAKHLYASITQLRFVLVRARIANIHSMCFVPTGWVYNEKTVVFPRQPFTVLQSNVHECWAREYSSTLRADMQYTPTDCFETFPFPPEAALAGLEGIGEQYHEHRKQTMLARQHGLTKTYNLFHDPAVTDPDITTLRALHRQMDEEVAAAYGWSDLKLDHGFHQTKQGLRFTISEPARREVLDRLLALNHQRYAEEVAAGLHPEKGTKRAAKAPKKPKAPPPAAAAAGSQAPPALTPNLFNFQAFVAPQPPPPSRDPPPDAPKRAGTLAGNAARSLVPGTLSDEAKRLLAALRASSVPLSKSQLLEACGLDPKSWTKSIATLASFGLITSTGTKRGTRYTATPESSPP